MLDKHLIAQTRPFAKQENMILTDFFRVTVLSSCLFRLEQNKKKKYLDKATQGVWFRDADVQKFSVKKEGKLTKIITDKATLVLGDSVEKSYVILNGKKVAINNQENLLGTYRTLDTCDGNMIFADTPKEYEMTLGNGVCSKNGVAVYDDSASLVLDENGKTSAREVEGVDIYVFAYGHDYRGAIRAFYQISGPVPLVPRYALGNWWSRYHAYSDKEYLNLLDRVMEDDVPLTVATIDMDWHWSETLYPRRLSRKEKRIGKFYGVNGEGAEGYDNDGWTGYSWNTDLFPDYKKTLNEIKKRNLKITLNLHPASGVRYFEDQYEEMAKAVGVDSKTSQHIPFDFTSDDFINAYFKVLHKPFEHDGVQFWWIDWQQGTKSALKGLDPLWSLNHYHTLDNAKEHEGLILSRYCGAGAHRYPLGFSGDSKITWKTLQYLPYFTSTASNIGYGWWSHDIGGHWDGRKSDELFLRHIQFGVFSPINRLHCCHEENVTKEPSVYMNGSGELIDKFLRFRHALIPYLYSASVDNRENGLCLMEPMYYSYPEHKEAYASKDQYFFGGQLLVAPVLNKGDKDKLAKTKVWLPEGKWTDIFTGDEFEGGKTITAVRWLNSLPCYLKEGGFLPLDARKHTNSVELPDNLKVLVANGNGEYVLYEDKEEQRATTIFTSKEENGRQIVKIVVNDKDGILPERKMTLEFLNIPDGKVTVTANGKETECVIKSDRTLLVTLEKVEKGTEYKIVVDFKEDKEEKRKARILYSMQRFEGGNFDNYHILQNLYALQGEDAKEYVKGEKLLTPNQKARLLEIL